MKNSNEEYSFDNLIKASFINENVLRVFVNEKTSFDFIEDNACKAVEATSKEEGSSLVVSTEDVSVVLKDSAISVEYKGKNIFADKYAFNIDKKKGISKEEEALLEAEGHLGTTLAASTYLISRTKEQSDVYYGLGDHAGFLNKRSYVYDNWNTDDPSPHNEQYRSLYKSAPYYICKNDNVVYGVFHDDTYKTTFDFGVEDTVNNTIKSDGGSLNFYIIFGDSIKDVTANYFALVGKMPLPARFMLGNQQSRWGYKCEKDILDVVSGYENSDIGLDVVFMDIDYMDNYKVFTVDGKKFPNVSDMLKKLKERGVRIVPIIDPGVKAEEGYSVYDEGIKEGHFARYNGEVYHNEVWPGDSVFPSFMSSTVRDFWKKQVRGLVDKGFAGVWNDMNEPASFKGPLPDDVKFFDENGNEYNHKEVHNVFGHFMARATYDGIKEQTNTRPYVITRAAYIGTQKYSTFWTGDNCSLWSHLQMSIPQILSMGLSGFVFSGVDVGGFGGAYCPPELLCRWIECAIFMPLCRNHAALGTRPQEPYRYSSEVQETYRKHVRLRYRLLPYLYDNFYKLEKNNLLPISPLSYHYESDKNTFEINDEFMVGDSVLVAPILNQGARARSVYLPDIFFDMKTQKIFKRGYHTVPANLDYVPVFVKRNSIIPTYIADTHVRDSYDTLEINIFGNVAEYTHYYDDGISFDYQSGKYNVYEFEYKRQILKLTITKLDAKSTYKKLIVHTKDKTETFDMPLNLSTVLFDLS